jgi:hypothetical protein
MTAEEARKLGLEAQEKKLRENLETIFSFIKDAAPYTTELPIVLVDDVPHVQLRNYHVELNLIHIGELTNLGYKVELPSYYSQYEHLKDGGSRFGISENPIKDGYISWEE